MDSDMEAAVARPSNMVHCDGVRYNTKDIPVEYQLEDISLDSEEEGIQPTNSDRSVPRKENELHRKDSHTRESGKPAE